MFRHTLTLTADQRQELVQTRDHNPRPYVRACAAALLKIADGASAHAVARTGLLQPRDPDTVYRWLRVYRAAGLAGLVHGPRRHGPPP